MLFCPGPTATLTFSCISSAVELTSRTLCRCYSSGDVVFIVTCIISMSNVFIGNKLREKEKSLFLHPQPRNKNEKDRQKGNLNSTRCLTRTVFATLAIFWPFSVPRACHLQHARTKQFAVGILKSGTTCHFCMTFIVTNMISE